MTEIYLHFLFHHYGLYGNAPVRSVVRYFPVFMRRRKASVVLPGMAVIMGAATGSDTPEVTLARDERAAHRFDEYGDVDGVEEQEHREPDLLGMHVER